MNHYYQTEAVRQAQQGHISASIETLQRQLDIEGQSYSVYSNLAALYIQIGDYQAAIENSTRATTIDPFSYIAYFNRFLCYLSTENFLLAWFDIQKALSCLNMIKGLKEGNVKFLNRAILHCEHNIRAYLIRAKINEGKNNKLAENDYSAAVEYAPNYPLIYQQRALFFRKLNRKKEFEDDLAKFIALSKETQRTSYQLTNNQNEEDSPNLKQKIEECIKQYQKLMADSSALKNPSRQVKKQPIVQRLPLNRIDDEQLLLNSDDLEQRMDGSLQFQKEVVQFKSTDSQIRQSNNVQQPFIDENTEYLNGQIEKLQQQIRADGGILTLEKEDNSELEVSDPNTFYSAEIQQTTEEINRLSKRQALNQVRSVKSAHSGRSISSKLSEPREITFDEFKTYSRFRLEIISLQDLQNSSRKELAKVQVQYGDNTFETSMNKFEWREEFTSDLDQDLSQVQVNVILKGGVFKSTITLGQGTINLLESGNTKCILANKQTKTAILYFKLKLF